MKEHLLAKKIDLARLNGETDYDQIIEDMREYGFRSVCVNHDRVRRLGNYEFDVSSVVDFPEGVGGLDEKLFEAEGALKDGANELDVVMNWRSVKNGRYLQARKELYEITKTAGDKKVKAIVEAPMLSWHEIILTSRIAADAGCKYVKSATGRYGNTERWHGLAIKQALERYNVGIKIAGGIQLLDDAEGWLDLAQIIGTSHGIAIINQLRYKEHYEENIR